MKFSNNALTLEGSATLQFTARANALKAAGKDIVSLTAGQPDFRTPQVAIDAAKAAMDAGKTLYTPSVGIPELREAVAARWAKRHNLNYSLKNVMVSCGAKHSIANLIEAAVNFGDKVLVPKPFWVSYPQMILRFGAIPIYPRGSGMLITGDDIRVAAKNGAVGMIFNSPSNPSGLVHSIEEITDVAEAIKDTGIWVISDDIYEDLYYGEGAVPHILTVAPELQHNVALATGVSKTYAMTGWRIGFAIANTDWIGVAGKIQAHSTSNPCSVSQYAALAVVNKEAETDRLAMFKAFKRRRDLICNLLDNVDGLEFERPEGAFYVFPKILSDKLINSNEFCLSLLENYGLGTIPGSAFGTEGYIRLSFAASDEDIKKAVKRLETFIKRGDFL